MLTTLDGFNFNFNLNLMVSTDCVNECRVLPSQLLNFVSHVLAASVKITFKITLFEAEAFFMHHHRLHFDLN